MRGKARRGITHAASLINLAWVHAIIEDFCLKPPE